MNVNSPNWQCWQQVVYSTWTQWTNTWWKRWFIIRNSVWMLSPCIFSFPSHADARRRPISFALRVEADALQHLQEAPVGFNLTACLHEGLVMRDCVHSVYMRQNGTHTQVLSELVYSVVFLDKYHNQTPETAFCHLSTTSICFSLKLWWAAFSVLPVMAYVL